ncbi:MAG: hypothetical protein KJ623_02970 [Nanoarchaeota archaeon]|nr:hypothetical protein [Nanoarchaeota archaeon]
MRTLENGIVGKKDLNLKKGDQVLVIDKTYEIWGSAFHGSPYAMPLIDFCPTKYKTKFSFGVLNKDFEDIISKDTKNQIVFPTRNHLERQEIDDIYTKYDKGECIRLWHYNEGDLVISPGFNQSHADFYVSGFNNIDFNKKPKRGELDERYNGTFILAGEEVPEYFTSYDKENTWFKNELDLSYIIAMNMLKQDIPEQYKNLFKNQLEKRAYYIYNSIISLEGIISGSKEEVERARAISKLPKTEDSTIEGDEVFFMLSTHEKREEINHKRNSLKYFITEALLLGLDKMDLKIQLREGITLDFPRYIKGLCRQYKIK